MVKLTVGSSANDAVQVRREHLIALAHAARSLSLRRNRIRSSKTDSYRSTFKGRGMEYDESRLYYLGDDVRHLDWRVMARTGEAYTKLFCEERERPVYFCVDCRAPMFFATRRCFKLVEAANIAALLAWSAMHEGDRVGGILFADDTHTEIKPQRGKQGVLQLIHQLADFSSYDYTTAHDGDISDGAEALMRLAHIVRPGSLIFLISDFRYMKTAENKIRELAAHSEVVLIQVYDPLEKALPPPGEYSVSDGEDSICINTADADFIHEYAERFNKRTMHLKSFARKLRVGFIQCQTSEEPLEVLRRSFGAR